jgi:hypothetical protein
MWGAWRKPLLYYNENCENHAAAHRNLGRAYRLPRAVVSAAVPRFQTRIITVASRSWNSANAVDVILMDADGVQGSVALLERG